MEVEVDVVVLVVVLLSVELEVMVAVVAHAPLVPLALQQERQAAAPCRHSERIRTNIRCARLRHECPERPGVQSPRADVRSARACVRQSSFCERQDVLQSRHALSQTALTFGTAATSRIGASTPAHRKNASRSRRCMSRYRQAFSSAYPRRVSGLRYLPEGGGRTDQHQTDRSGSSPNGHDGPPWLGPRSSLYTAPRRSDKTHRVAARMTATPRLRRTSSGGSPLLALLNGPLLGPLALPFPGRAHNFAAR